MNIVWILVCDAAHARLYESHSGTAEWKLVQSLRHPESQAKGSDLVTDGSGARSSEGASVHHNALAPTSSPKEVEKGHFAHTLAKMLNEAMRAGRFSRWVLAAPPHFLGLLKKELTPELERHLMHTVDKDLNHLGTAELSARLHDQLRVPVQDIDVVAPPPAHH